MDAKPFSQACENNKAPILEHLKKAFQNVTKVLEIGSGTGQHAVHFAPLLPHLMWQTADQSPYHDGILAWLADFPSKNLLKPLEISLPTKPWPQNGYDGFFTANTTHIMQACEVRLMMQLVEKQLPPKGVFCQYGPFIQNGQFSSQSNRDFHTRLVSEGYGGYRSIEELQAWCKTMVLESIVNMPANNLLLIWKKKPESK